MHFKDFLLILFQKQKYYRIQVTDSGFSVFAINKKTHIEFSAQWDEINKLEAYKIDQFTTDLLCIKIYLKNENAYNLHEDMQGFYNLLEAFKEKIPGYSDKWYEEVLQPPFEENLKVIYERKID